jgi:hypothetical protein
MSNKNIMQYNEKNQRHGLWERYSNDILWFKCFFHNDNVVGYEEYHYITGGNNCNGKLGRKRYYL